MSKSLDICVFSERQCFFSLTVNSSVTMLSPSAPYPAF